MPSRRILILPFIAQTGLLMVFATTGCTTVPSPALPEAKVINVFAPPGESNVRSSFRLADGSGLVGTEENGHIYKTTDGGLTWAKVFDGGTAWGIADVRNFIRAQDGHLYVTTTEPALVARSTNGGTHWEIMERAPASRTVGLVQLDDGTLLVGLRRSENGKTSILRSEDYFQTRRWIPLADDAPRQNVTCFGYWGGQTVLAGVGFEGSGKVYKSADGGRTWTQTAEFPEARDLMDFVKAGDTLYVLASGIASLFQSTDEGETWTLAHRFWPRGFLGQCVPYERNGRRYLLMSATDQSQPVYRHLVLISADDGATWQEWIDLAEESKGAVTSAKESGGGASNLTVLSPDRILVGVGNHAVQGRVYTLQVAE